MRKDMELFYLLDHPEYYEKDENDYYFIPNDKAPPEAIEAMRNVNRRLKWDKDHGAHSY